MLKSFKIRLRWLHVFQVGQWPMIEAIGMAASCLPFMPVFVINVCFTMLQALAHISFSNVYCHLWGLLDRLCIWLTVFDCVWFFFVFISLYFREDGEKVPLNIVCNDVFCLCSTSFASRSSVTYNGMFRYQSQPNSLFKIWKEYVLLM